MTNMLYLLCLRAGRQSACGALQALKALRSLSCGPLARARGAETCEARRGWQPCRRRGALPHR
eukprot:14317452-Alexandrium_andersonii.AAC.1